MSTKLMKATENDVELNLDRCEPELISGRRHVTRIVRVMGTHAQWRICRKICERHDAVCLRLGIVPSLE